MLIYKFTQFCTFVKRESFKTVVLLQACLRKYVIRSMQKVYNKKCTHVVVYCACRILRSCILRSCILCSCILCSCILCMLYIVPVVYWQYRYVVISIIKSEDKLNYKFAVRHQFQLCKCMMLEAVRATTDYQAIRYRASTQSAWNVVKT